MDDRALGRFADFNPTAKIVHIDIDAAEHGKNISTVAPILGDGWSETRSYLGGHAGIGFEAIEQNGISAALEFVSFVVARLDGSDRPDGAEGRGGFGFQIRLAVGYAWSLNRSKKR